MRIENWIEVQMNFFYQYTILDGTRWCPVEHASAVVLHLGLLEVKVLGLVVRDPNLELAVLLLVRWFICRPGRGFDMRVEAFLHTFLYIDQYPGNQSIYKGFVHFMFKGCFTYDHEI